MILSKGVFDVVGSLFDLFVQEDYFDPCTYGNNANEEVDFDVDGDNDEKINCRFKDFDLHELENLKASGHQHNIHFKIWVANAFNAW
jgi:hypothetical protein